MSHSSSSLTTSARLASMLLDHFIMTTIMILIIVAGLLPIFLLKQTSGDASVDFPTDLFLFLTILGLTTYFNKDLFNSQSPAKRILGLQIVDTVSGLPASPIKCLIRNCTALFGLVELFFITKDPGQRFGDKIAGTRVVRVAAPLRRANNPASVITPLLITFAFFSVTFTPLLFTGQTAQTGGIEYKPDSYNPDLSDAGAQYLQAELGHIIHKADIKVYEQVKGDPSKSFMSGILYLRDRDNLENFEYTEAETARILTRRFRQNTKGVHIKFIHEESDQTLSREKLYEW